MEERTVEAGVVTGENEAAKGSQATRERDGDVDGQKGAGGEGVEGLLEKDREGGVKEVEVEGGQGMKEL